MGGFQTVSSKTNRISDTKTQHFVYCFSCTPSPCLGIFVIFWGHNECTYFVGFGHLIKVLYNGTLVIELCANFWTYMIPTYLIALCARFSFFLNNLRAQFVPKPWYRVDDNPTYKCLPGWGAGVGPRKKKDRLMPSWSSGWHDSPSHLGGQGVGPGNLFHGAFNLATQTIVC